MDVNVINGLGTSYGLALASGVNAYVPLLFLVLSPHKPMPPQFAWIGSPGFLIALVVLALLDVILDKIPVVDTFWDSIHTAVRPVMGALVTAVSMSIYGPTSTTELSYSGMALASISSSTGVTIPLLGGVLAGAGHTTKAVGRLTVAIGAFGCFNTIISILEDAVMVVIVLLSFFSPTVMLGIAGCMALLFLLFSPTIFEAFIYNMRVSSSLFAWTVLPFVWMGGESTSTNVLLSLSEEERERLYTVLPPPQTPKASVRLLWLRRLNKRGPWGHRRIAPPTWLIVLQDRLMFYPPSRPELTREISITDIKSYKFKKSIFMGLLQIMTHDGRVYTFAVLKDALEKTVEYIHTYFPADPGQGGSFDRENNDPLPI